MTQNYIDETEIPHWSKIAGEIRIPKSFDALPPVVWAEGEWFTTRVLDSQHRDLEDENLRLADKIEALEAENARLKQREAELVALLERLVDPDPCQYDHHGYCQAHSLDEYPCPHEQAKEFLNKDALDKGGE